MPIVMKFGGSSVADAPCMRQVAGLVREAAPRHPLVVLSAMGKTTNTLLDAARAAERGDAMELFRTVQAIREHHRNAAKELFPEGPPLDLVMGFAELFGELEMTLRGVTILQELSPRSQDAVASFGERLSSLLLATYLRAPLVDARTLVRTDDSFGEARPQPDVLRELCASRLPPTEAWPLVTQGFIGATADGLTTTLGRGGSDYSAALFGAAIDAKEIQIWTDVEGVLTCDPRVVPEARSVDELTFAEAAELAAFGAKVLHPSTMQPAAEAEIPVTVRHTQRPHGRFTTIAPHTRSDRAITALASRGPVTVLTLDSTRMLNQAGFLARLFEVFRRHDVSVDLIATAEVSVSLTVEADVPLDVLVPELSTFATVKVDPGRSIIAVVGERMRQTPGAAGRVLSAMGNINVELISMGANEINLSMVVPAQHAPLAMARLHRALVAEHPELQALLEEACV